MIRRLSKRNQTHSVPYGFLRSLFELRANHPRSGDLQIHPCSQTILAAPSFWKEWVQNGLYDTLIQDVHPAPGVIIIPQRYSYADDGSASLTL
jgi:hypothetical protein